MKLKKLLKSLEKKLPTLKLTVLGMRWKRN